MSRRKQRDEEFEFFVRARSPRLRLIARSICRDEHLADDLVQEALERTYLSWHKLDDDPMAWARRVLVNLNIDRFRRRRVNEVGLEQVDAPDPHDGVAAVIGDSHLDALMAELTPRERAVVTLRYLEDLSEADTARELDIPIGTVKSTTNRAITRLRNRSLETAAL